jgi:hypothetical protein
LIYLHLSIDLNGHEWTAIGTYDHRFKGNFDGKDHVISGLRINKPAADYQGLFGYLDGAEIRNLGLKDVAIMGKSRTGGIAGYVSGGSIDNSYSTGTVSGSQQVGGIAGFVSGSNIENSYSTGAVSGTGSDVGGIAGYVYSNSSIENSYSTGAVSGTFDVGGIAGYVGSNSSIENCAALNPSVTATSSISAGRVAGGIAGTFTGNKAWAEMVVTWTVTDNSEKDGEGISKAQVKDDSGFPFDVNEEPWAYTTGNLPILKGLAGQDDTLPEHLAAD